MERARGRDRGPADDGRALGWDRVASTRDEIALVEPEDDESVDVDGFPVMVRLTEIQHQLGALVRRMERFGEALERIEETIARGALARAGRELDEPFRNGVTARANPMTHPVTPPSVRAPVDTGREEALATVRALFARSRRPWWQRLPDLLRG